MSANTHGVCNSCNFPLSGSEFFCPTCGHQVRGVGDDAAYVYECRLCGAPISDEMAECSACGYRTNGPGAVILIVDDDLEIVELLENVFREEAYHPIYSSGSDAVAVASVRQPDVIMLDLMMPDVHGLSVLEGLKANERTKDIPVLLTSAGLRLRLLARHAEAEGTIEKPFDVDNLVSEVRRLLSERQSQWELSARPGSEDQ